VADLIIIEVKDEAVRALLGRLESRMQDMSPVMADVAQAMASEAEHNFETQSGPLGPWPALSEETTIPFRKKKKAWPGKMLQVSSAGLAASVQSSFGPDFARIGSNKAYAAMHQFGGTTSPRSMIPGKTIPARPYLPIYPDGRLQDHAQNTLLEILEGYLTRV
jgi:phage virion morphogenesis protein